MYPAVAGPPSYFVRSLVRLGRGSRPIRDDRDASPETEEPTDSKPDLEDFHEDRIHESGPADVDITGTVRRSERFAPVLRVRDRPERVAQDFDVGHARRTAAERLRDDCNER